MMISSFRKELGKDESGQAIILGAVSLLVLAVGIMSTAQLGWAIKERIQLQHAADNAAYTTATMVARSMNFISWTNRAMISQYVSAMSFQSLMTYLDAQVVLVAQLAASLLSFGFAFGVAARALQASILLSWLSPPFELAAVALGNIGHGIREMLNNIVNPALDVLDRVLAVFVWGISMLNAFYYWAEAGARYFLDVYFISGAASGLASLFGGGATVGGFYTDAIQGTSSGANQDAGGYDALAFALGSGLTDRLPVIGNLFVGYQSLFDKNSTKTGRGVGDSYKAEALMTEMVNATRLNFETNRKGGLGGIIASFIGGDSGGEHGSSAINFLENILPTSYGASAMTSTMASRGQNGYLGEVGAADIGDYKNILNGKHSGPASSKYNGNPVFDGYAPPAKMPWSTSGETLMTVDVIPSALGSLPWPLDLLVDFISNLAEMIPINKGVGIQATGDKTSIPNVLLLSTQAGHYLKGMYGNSYHCKYDNIGVIDTEEICGLTTAKAEETKQQCLEKCNDCSRRNEEGECVERPKDEGGNEYKTCSECATEYENAIKSGGECEEAAKEGGDAAYTALKNTFHGAPVKVVIGCDQEEGRHKFWGVTPYVSFDSAGYHERLRDTTQEEYPSFWGFAHKEPTFMKGGAIGFGDKFNKDNKFKMSSVGAIEGVTSRDPGECDDGFGEGLECSKDGYTYNHMDDEDVVFLTKGMHAWARSQVYYHRPGAWAEPPNLFNPYWKPKLSPIAPIFTNQTSRLNNIPLIGTLLGNIIGEAVETVISH